MEGVGGIRGMVRRGGSVDQSMEEVGEDAGDAGDAGNNQNLLSSSNLSFNLSPNLEFRILPCFFLPMYVL